MIKLFMKYLKPYRGKVMIIICFVLLSTMSNLTLPMLSKKIINQGIGFNSYATIWITAAIMLVVLIIAMLCMIMSNKISSIVSMGFSRDLRGGLFAHICHMSQGDLEKTEVSSLISRQTNDVLQLQTVLAQMLTMMLTAPIMCIGGIIMAYLTAPELSWIILCILPVSIALVFLILIQVNPLFKINQQKLDHVNQVIREILNGMRVIRAFNKEKYEEKHFNEASQDLMQIALRANRVMTILLPIMTLCVNGANILIIWNGGHNMVKGITTYGDVQAFIQYVSMILMSLMMTSMLMVTLPRAITSAGRINEVLQTEPSIQDPEQPLHFPEVEKVSLSFQHVDFLYPGADEKVLSDIDFSVQAGETLAIIGGTGSGKSTILSLLNRFYDVSAGSIQINGIDIRSVSQEQLRSRVGMVPQKAFLFGGSIFENVCYGKQNASEEEVEYALEIAQAKSFIEEKEFGIYSYITPAGANLSGGQKQRLAIARALVRKPDIYVFDDSFSALDFKTDATLRQALKQEVKNAIMIIVAQRVGTIMDADKIIVLENGRIIGQGTHNELRKECKVYREIALSQLTESEVDA